MFKIQLQEIVLVYIVVSPCKFPSCARCSQCFAVNSDSRLLRQTIWGFLPGFSFFLEQEQLDDCTILYIFIWMWSLLIWSVESLIMIKMINVFIICFSIAKGAIFTCLCLLLHCKRNCSGKKSLITAGEAMPSCTSTNNSEFISLLL